MITVQVLAIIISACQVTGTHAGSDNGTDYVTRYDTAKNVQILCQKSLIKCVQEKDKKQNLRNSLEDCLLER